MRNYLFENRQLRIKHFLIFLDQKWCLDAREYFVLCRMAHMAYKIRECLKLRSKVKWKNFVDFIFKLAYNEKLHYDLFY